MKEERMTEQQSLQLIQQMIQTAKNEQRDNGRGWIWWGWMLFAASVLTALNQQFYWVKGTYTFWNLFGGFTVLYFLYSTIRYAFFKRTERVKTYTGDLFQRLNAGFFISLFFIILALNTSTIAVYKRFAVWDMTTINTGFALLISLYAFWGLIYGTVLNFRPSIAGAYCAWAIGIAALFMKSFQTVMWLHALAVLAGFIIPGYLANRAFNKIKKEAKVIAGV